MIMSGRKDRLGLSAVVLAAALTMLLATPTFASDPTRGTGGEPVGDDTVLPLTPEQRTSVLLKESLLAGALADQAADGITPDYACIYEPCEPRSKALTVYPRQQAKGIYCGPAVVQIVSNYSWGKTGSQNAYSQQTISDNWTHTDANQQTYLGDEITGMNLASVKPVGFVYAQKHNPTYSNWHATIIEDVHGWRMPLAAGVIPWKTGGTYHLVSWNKVSNTGHYIELHGYSGYISDPTKSVYFSDTAGTYADSVAGNYYQNSYAVYQTMMYNNGNMIW